MIQPCRSGKYHFGHQKDSELLYIYIAIPFIVAGWCSGLARVILVSTGQMATSELLNDKRLRWCTLVQSIKKRNDVFILIWNQYISHPLANNRKITLCPILRCYRSTCNITAQLAQKVDLLDLPENEATF